ncbi:MULTISPECIES: hypothetical protein [Bacillaceae]|uniref:Uncharacterized protein n=1 Tax=Evansella alkalicola TaxID=745819 RepID=A0ABS6JTP8_9BACI|nr:MULTISPECIES: hypothetical protein [Bacillaceae]MBU9721939.1 hypothetical protein [Bacillus alkalicola]
MISLSTLVQSYGFKHADWEVEGEVLKTEKGLKRISYWADQDQVLWHIKWRDHLADKTGYLTNRMIQTLNGERMILTDEGWLTLHDNVTSLFPYKDREGEFGKFIGQYFSLNIEEPGDYHDPVNMDRINNHLKYPINQGFSEEIQPFIERLRKEALLRLSKAKRLREESFGEEATALIPVVSPIFSLDQGKIVFEKLYWQHGTERPEKGYRSLQIILSQWLQRYGKKSLYTLLYEIDKHFPLKKNHFKNLLADCLTPWEFTLFLEQIQKIDDPNQMEVLKEKLTFQWEESRQLVKALSEWFDLTREKVPTV